MKSNKNTTLLLPTFLFFIFTITPLTSLAQYEKGDSLFAKYSTTLKAEAGVEEEIKDIKGVPEGAILINKKYLDTVLGHYKVEHQGDVGYISETSVSVINKENRDEILKWKKERQKLIKDGLELLISYTKTSLNSAGGLSFSVKFFNNSPKRTIKYIRFYLVPFNAVGDIVRGTVDGESEKTVRGVGPVKPKSDAFYDFDNVWYNSTIECVELRRIDVEYTDGHSFTYINDLPKVIKDKEDVDMRGDCSK